MRLATRFWRALPPKSAPGTSATSHDQAKHGRFLGARAEARGLLKQKTDRLLRRITRHAEDQLAVVAQKASTGPSTGNTLARTGILSARPQRMWGLRAKILRKHQRPRKHPDAALRKGV